MRGRRRASAASSTGPTIAVAADLGDIYAQAGVSHVWLVDPVLQTLEALQLESGGYRLLGSWYGPAKTRIEPFDAIELELSPLWSR